MYKILKNINIHCLDWKVLKSRQSCTYKTNMKIENSIQDFFADPNTHLENIMNYFFPNTHKITYFCDFIRHPNMPLEMLVTWDEGDFRVCGGILVKFGEERVCGGILVEFGKEREKKGKIWLWIATRILTSPFMIQSMWSKSIPKQIAYQNFHNHSLPS